MLRAEIVQTMLSLFTSGRYLEIGVDEGVTFSAVKAASKVGVDPKFCFDTDAMKAADATVTLHEATSDTYFGEIIDPTDRFDVVFIDGLHTAEQTYRDIVNALEYLEPNGVIVVDDVRPNSYAAALREFKDAHALRAGDDVQDSSWMGDVYRIVFMLDTFHQQLRFATVSETEGQLVVWRDRRGSVREQTIEEIGRLPFERVIIERQVYNLMPLAEIAREIRSRSLLLAP